MLKYLPQILETVGVFVIAAAQVLFIWWFLPSPEVGD